jgi:hypothetical protein
MPIDLAGYQKVASGQKLKCRPTSTSPELATGRPNGLQGLWLKKGSRRRHFGGFSGVRASSSPGSSSILYEQGFATEGITALREAKHSVMKAR